MMNLGPVHRRFWLAALLWGCAGFGIGFAWAEPVLTLGFGTNKPPYVFEQDRRGLEVDIVLAAARRGGLRVKPVFVPMERLRQLFADREIDAISCTNSNARLRGYFSQTAFKTHNVAISLSSRHLHLTRIEDLGHYSISTFQQARILLGEEFGDAVRNNPEYREEAAQVRRNLKLYSGRVDVVIGDLKIFRYFNSTPEVRKLVDVMQPIDIHPLFDATSYQVAFLHREDRDRFDQGLKALIDSGEYQAIEKRYADY